MYKLECKKQRRAVDAILKASLPKLREKLLEALQAVLPIAAIVLVLCFTIAPVSPSILLCFLLGAAMIVVGIMFFTLGAEMSMTPMGERVGAVITKSRRLPVVLGIGSIMKAKRVLLVVNGEKKAQAVKDCFFGPIKPQAPGSILQLHPDFTLVADEAALSLVKDLL